MSCAAPTANSVWNEARGALDGLPGGGLNIAFECVDRHARDHGGRTAIRWLGTDGRREEITYEALRERTARFAAALAALGVGPGERVFSFLGRVPEVYVTALGTLRAGAVFCPLFSAFGPEPLRARLEIGEGRVLVTTAALYRRKVAALRAALPRLEHVLLLGDDAPMPDDAGVRDFHALVDAAGPGADCAPTSPEDAALLHFTSGTTGRPKGAVHVHEAVVAHHATARAALDLREGDVFWCTADPGWVTGTSYGIVGPLSVGATLIADDGEFDAGRWYRILEEEEVAVWYTAPTAVRMLMRLGAEAVEGRHFPALRHAASVGEPLNPEGVTWGERVLGRPIHDTWWQTETGAIMIANLPGEAVRPGAMGRPVPGIDAALVRHGHGGTGPPEWIDTPEAEGEIALRAGWPSMFRGYLGDPERYAASFADGWYLTGDLARRDAEGRFWFVGRADDVIKSSGHLIGPIEVENALMSHAAVAEAGVIGVPDPLIGESVKAFVALKPGHEPDAALRRELLAHARQRLGASVAPRDIAFRPSLPKTRSGKIMRRLLKARELGLPEGDLSTLVGDGDTPDSAETEGSDT